MSEPEQKPEPVKLKMPKLHWKETQDKISEIETMLGAPMLCYYTSPASSIGQQHADFFLEHLYKKNEITKFYLFLVSYGGSGAAALRIANIIRDYCKELIILVPSRCASAATLISLAGDKIIMTPSGYLTAIDSSFTNELNPKGNDGRPLLFP